MTLDSFWDWSVSAYGRPGAKEACLTLQDVHGLDVNMVLWCLWTSVEHRPPNAARLAAAAGLSAHFQREVVGPLRAARRAMTSPPSGVDAPRAMEVRAHILQVELAAERLEQEALERLVMEVEVSPGDVRARAEQALADYAQIAAPGLSIAFGPLMDAILT